MLLQHAPLERVRVDGPEVGFDLVETALDPLDAGIEGGWVGHFELRQLLKRERERVERAERGFCVVKRERKEMGNVSCCILRCSSCTGEG